MSSTNHGDAPSYKAKEPIKVRFGKHLAECRLSRGLTQMQLALISGLDRSFISDMERGVKEPTLSTLELLAVSFKMSLSEFFKTL